MWLLSPLTWLLVAVLLFPLAGRAHRRRMWMMACAVLALLAIMAMTPLVAEALVGTLERAIAVSTRCRSDPPSTVVVLGGGVDRLPRNQRDYGVMNIASRRRMEYAVDYWRTHRNVQLVLAGGAVAKGYVDNANLMAQYGEAMAIPRLVLRLEPRSRNTHENAQYIAQLVPRVPRRIGLVTSAMHMPRAQIAFGTAGFDVCPLPTDFRAIQRRPPGNLIPNSRALVKTEAALRELAGIVVYRWREWRAEGRSQARSD